MAVAKARSHPYLVNNAFLGTWRPHAKILPDWSLINFFKPKLLPVGVAMTKLHPLPCPHVFNNAHLGSRRVVIVFSRDAKTQTFTNRNIYIN